MREERWKKGEKEGKIKGGMEEWRSKRGRNTTGRLCSKYLFYFLWISKLEVVFHISDIEVKGIYIQHTESINTERIP